MDHERESERLAAVRALGVAPPTEDLLALTRVAAYVTGAQTAALHLVDDEEVWQIAPTGGQPRRIARADAPCSWVVDHDEAVSTADASCDPRFAASPYVDGRLAALRTYASEPLRDPDGNVLGTLCVLDDREIELDDGQRACLADLAVQAVALLRARRALEQLDGELLATRAAMHVDELTGLPNRAAAQRALRTACERGSTGLLYLDVDDFQAINDLAGHRAGDEALRELARRVQDALRPADVVARLAGDEFVVLLPRLATVGDLDAVVRRLRSSVHGPLVLPDETTVLLSVSVGAVLLEAGCDPERALHAADVAMYRDKSSAGERAPAEVPAARQPLGAVPA